MNPPKDRCAPMGNHLVHIDGDSLFVIARGTLTYDDMEQLLDHLMHIKKEQGRLFVLYDGRLCTGIDREARRLASLYRKPEADADLRVAFGVSFTVRVMLAMLLRAQKVIINRDVHVQLFEHEHEAYACFEKERARIRRELKK